MSVRDPFSKSGLFEQAVRRLLRPLVRALIAQGMTAPALYRIIKQTYVEVAETDLKSKATDSRISVVTGVHRRDVKDFRSANASEDTTVGRKVSMLASVIGRWMSDATYTDDTGAPVSLPRSAETGPSFDGLVESISRDVRPRTILDELDRQNIVLQDDDGIRLMMDGLFGSADIDQKLHFFSHNLGDHVQAAVDNLMSEEAPHFERAVFYNYLTEDSVSDIETQARQISMDALQQVNALAAAHQATDKSDPKATYRFRFGQFFYHEDESDRDEQGKTSHDDP
jgi:hypothetical protein